MSSTRAQRDAPRAARRQSDKRGHNAPPSPEQKQSSHAQRTGKWTRLRQSRWWPWLTRGLGVAFFLLVASLIFHQARSVDWPEVWTSVKNLPASALWLGAALALASHITYASFELIGKHVTGHRLSRPVTLSIAFMSYEIGRAHV